MALTTLAELMECAAFGTWRYVDYETELRKSAKRLKCAIEDLEERVDVSVYDIPL